MKTQLKLMLLIIAVSLIVFTGCKKQALPVATTIEQGSVLGKAGGASPELTQSEQGSALGKAVGATQISGAGFFDATDECNSPSQGAAYAIKMTGDLEPLHFR